MNKLFLILTLVLKVVFSDVNSFSTSTFLRLSEDHEFYFDSNCFHRISLTKLLIRDNILEGFIPYIQTMKSIIIHIDENDQSLLDTQCIACVTTENYSFNIQNMNYFIRKYANIPNPIKNFFNKINYVRLCEDYSKNIECLEAMKKVPLYVKTISISSNNAEELEDLTDPNLLNTQISILKLVLESIKISDKTIENLQAIYPNSITLRDDSQTKDESTKEVLFGNFTKLLSKLDKTSLELEYYGNSNKFEIEFNDVIFKVVESKKECSYIRAKSVEIHCKGEELYWIKSGDLNMSVLDSYYLCLNKSRYIKISEFIRIKDQEEIKEVEKMLNNKSLSEINKGIIIPMKYSHKIFFTIKE